MKTLLTITAFTVLILFQNGIQAQKLRNKIVKSIVQFESSYSSIQEDRKVLLDQLASRITKGSKNDEDRTIVFVDKRNKEKSQLAAIWLRTGLQYYGLNNYNVLSAGTEPIQEPFPALASLEEYGFRVGNASKNPSYAYTVKSGSETWPVTYTTFEALNLTDDSALRIYVEEGIAPEDGPKQIEISLFSPERIAMELLYVSSRIKYVNEQYQ